MAHIVIDARNRESSTGRYTDRLLEYLQKLDKENRYSILLAPSDKWAPKAKSFQVVPCRFKQFSFNPWDQVAYARQLYRLCPDLVHFTMTQQPIFYFGNIVTTTHDLTMLRYARAGRLPGWLHAVRMLGYRFLFWWGHKKSKTIIVPSRYVAEDLSKHQLSAKNKTTVIYEASDKIVARGKWLGASKVKGPFILHVGSPFPHKNIERLIEAFAKLENKRLQLVLAGKEEYYFSKLKGWVKTLPVADSIKFTGFITDSELKWLYENAEAYVLPSLSEGFGLPGLEAMVHGCPVVSSNATCLPEIYGDAALYFNPYDTDDIAKTINGLLNNPSLHKDLIKKGKKQASKYSWAKTAEQTLEVYKRLVI